LHADLQVKEPALAPIAPVNGNVGLDRPPDSLIALLEAL
jgi:hypothetical protein